VTFFDTDERPFINSVPAEQAAFAPRAGFLEAFNMAWDVQTKAWSQFGLEYALREQEQEMFQRIRSAGAEPPASLNDYEDKQIAPGVNFEGFMAGVNSGAYLDAARLYAGDVPDSQDITGRLAERDKRLEELRNQFPNAGIRTYREMFDDVRAKAQEAERRLSRTPFTFGGYLGEFAGGAAGSLAPTTDPLNAATIGVGGIGRTALTRIATEGGAQAGIETINQFTGVQENRQLMGLEYGLSQAALQVATTGLGGAMLRGIGEGGAAVARRWFRDAPGDPAPSPEGIIAQAPSVARREAPDALPTLRDTTQPLRAPNAPEPPPVARVDYVRLLGGSSREAVPWAQSRLGQQRFEQDVRAVAEQLEGIGGRRPAEVQPARAADANTVTEVRREGETTARSQRPQSGSPDPYAERVRDKLVQRRASLVSQDEPPLMQGFVRLYHGGAISDGSHALKNNFTSHRKRAESFMQSPSDDLFYVDVPKGDDLLESIALNDFKTNIDVTIDPGRYGGARNISNADEVADLDAKIEKAQRLVDRAEAAQRGEWPKVSGDEPEPARARPDSVASPDVRTTPDYKVNPDRITAEAEVQRHMEIMDDALENFRATIGTLMESGDELQLPDGRTLHLDNDFMVVPTQDGEGTKTLTVRAILKEVRDQEDVFKAVQTCSAPKTSSPA
jgi:hypothetical protein